MRSRHINGYDLVTWCRADRKHFTTEQIKRVFNVHQSGASREVKKMLAAGLIVEVGENTHENGGRPAKVYCFHPDF